MRSQLSQTFYQTSAAYAPAPGGGGDAAQTTAFIAAADGVSSLSTNYRAAYKVLINGLFADGTLQKMDLFYVFKAPNQGTAAINIVTPASFGITAINSAPFTANVGWDAVTSGGKYLSTGYNPTSNTINFSTTSAHIGVYVSVGTGSAGAAMGADSFLDIYPDIGGDTYFRIEDNPATGPIATEINRNGYWVGNRSGSSGREAYKNATPLGPYTGTLTNSTLTNATVLIGNDSFGATDQTITAAHLGGSLTSGDVTAIKGRLDTFFAAVP